MTVKVRARIIGADRLDRKLSRMGAAVDRGAVRGLGNWGKMVVKEMKDRINNDPKTGILYNRPGLRKRSSAAGEAPTNQTGRLIRSLKALADISTKSVVISAGTLYALWLEFGTLIMEARPFMIPSVQSLRGLLATLVGKPIKVEIAKVAKS